MIYLDSSALVTLIARRQFSAELRGYLAGRPPAPMATSTLGFIETVRTLDKLGDFPGVLDQLLTDITEVVLTDGVRDAATRVPAAVRSLDAIHIASAQALGEALDVLVTYDKRMLAVARAVELPIASPGMDA